MAKKKISKRRWPIPKYFNMGGKTGSHNFNDPRMRIGGDPSQVVPEWIQEATAYLQGVMPLPMDLPENYSTQLTDKEEQNLNTAGQATTAGILGLTSTIAGAVGGGSGMAVSQAIPGLMEGQNTQEYSDNNVPKAMGGKITMSRKDFLKEHYRLLKALKSSSHKDDLSEYDLQSKEMKEYLGGGGYYQNGGDFTDITGGFNHQDSNPLNVNQGVPINDNTIVEQGETIFNPENYVFSDRIKVPGTKLTFAQKSKQINRRYKLRPDDTLANDSKNAELKKLMEEQESIKKAKADQYLQKAIELNPDIAQDMQLGEQMEGQMGMQEPIEMKAGGKIYIKPSKRGSLHEHLGIPQDEKIPLSDLQIKESDSEAIRKKKQFAINARKWKNYGGKYYPNGGTFDPPTYEEWMIQNYPNSEVALLNKPNLTPLSPESFAGSPTGSRERFEDILISDYPEITPNPLSSYLTSPEPTINELPLEPEQLVDDIPSGTPKVRGSRRWTKALPGMIGSLSPAVANLITGATLPDAKLTANVNFDEINATPAINIAQKEAETSLASGMKALKEGSINPGNYLTNVTMAAAQAADNLSKNIAAIKYQEELGNIDLSTREKMINAEIQKYNNMIQDQDAAQRAFMYQTAAKQFGDSLQSANRDIMKYDMEDQMMDWLGTSDYGLTNPTYDKAGNIVLKPGVSYRGAIRQLPDGRLYMLDSDNNVIFVDEQGNPLKS